jgi:hypothetical protein
MFLEKNRLDYFWMPPESCGSFFKVKEKTLLKKLMCINCLVRDQTRAHFNCSSHYIKQNDCLSSRPNSVFLAKANEFWCRCLEIRGFVNKASSANMVRAQWTNTHGFLNDM